MPKLTIATALIVSAVALAANNPARAEAPTIALDGDPQMLRRALSNLPSNALRHASPAAKRAGLASHYVCWPVHGFAPRA